MSWLWCPERDGKLCPDNVGGRSKLSCHLHRLRDESSAFLLTQARLLLNFLQTDAAVTTMPLPSGINPISCQEAPLWGPQWSVPWQTCYESCSRTPCESEPHTHSASFVPDMWCTALARPLLGPLTEWLSSPPWHQAMLVDRGRKCQRLFQSTWGAPLCNSRPLMCTLWETVACLPGVFLHTHMHAFAHIHMHTHTLWGKGAHLLLEGLRGPQDEGT